MAFVPPLLVQSLLALAEPSEAPWTLQWSAPAGCPAGSDVEAVVARWRAEAPEPTMTTTVHARAEVQALPTGGHALQLEIVADDVLTSHAVDAEDCVALADATALQIALAMGLSPQTLPRETAAPSPAADVAIGPPRVAPTRPEPTAAETPTRTSRRVDVRRADRPSPRRGIGLPRGLVRVQGGVGTGRVPRLDGRLGVAVGVVWPRVRLELVASHTFAQRASHPVLPSLRVRVWQWTALARGCWTPHLGPVELPLCAGLEAGATLGRGEGVTVPSTRAIAFVAPVATVAVVWPFTRWLALWVGVDGWVSIPRAAYTIGALLPWFTARRGGVDGVLGLEVRFP